jgi:hypothetical protein
LKAAPFSPWLGLSMPTSCVKDLARCDRIELLPL